MIFRVGQKVVCIGGQPKPDEPPPFPVKGAVYTVENVIDYGDELGLELVELPQPGCEGWAPGFLASAFRPAVDKKTDISIFQQMLNREGVPA